MKILPLITILGLAVQIAHSQPVIEYNKTEHDFGSVANLNYPPAAFQFTNSGNQPLAILMVNKTPSVKVRHTRGFIQPGETGQILVYPDVNKMGNFEEKLEVVTNANASPTIITVKGEVISTQACFPNPNDWNIRKVVVIDTDTKDPIANASIDFTHNMSKQFNGKTNRDGIWIGDMPIGQYNFALSASKYEAKQDSKYVPRSLPVIFLEMKMVPPTAPREEIAIPEPELQIEDIDIESEPIAIEDDLLPTNLYAANNLVLLLDVSYSMRANNKLGLLKQSTTNLVNVLRHIDNVSMITYAGEPKLIFKSVPGDKKKAINTKVHSLTAAGITNGVKGLESAYVLANANFISTGNNQIILATDGQFTGGTQQPEALKQMISSYAAKGIILSIIGFGVDENAKMFMQEMSELGNGTYIHVNTKDDISETLINEIKAKSRK